MKRRRTKEKEKKKKKSKAVHQVDVRYMVSSEKKIRKKGKK